ncbi:MAG: hypothetical protein V3V12_09170 [Gammaproteobacteria bacterium]
MKSRWIINILLLLSIGILTLISYYKPGVNSTDKNLLTHLQPEDISRISIRNPLFADIDLYKENDIWFIKADKPITADSTRVIALTQLASQAIKYDYSTEQMEPEKIGLSPPRSTITLNDQAIRFGSIDAIESLRYVQSNNKIALIPDNYQQQIHADRLYFVSPRIVQTGQRIQSIQLPGLTVTHTDHKWLTVPDTQESDSSITQFIAQWEKASAINMEDYKPIEKNRQIILYLRQPREMIHLDILASETSLVVGRRDIGLQYNLGGNQDKLLQIPNIGSTEQEK